MLSTAEIQAVLAEVSYRPGWTFEVFDSSFESPRIRIVGPVEDSYHPGTMLDLGINDFLPPLADEAALLSWLAWRLGRIESHEMREWLKRDGKPVFNPHTEPAIR